MSVKKDAIVGTVGTGLLVVGTIIEAPVILGVGAVATVAVVAKNAGSALFKFVDWWLK